MPVRLHGVDSLAVAHPVSAAIDVQQVDGVIGQGGGSVRSRSVQGFRRIVVRTGSLARNRLFASMPASIPAQASQMFGRSGAKIWRTC